MPVEQTAGSAGKYSHCDAEVDQTEFTVDDAPAKAVEERDPYFDIPMWRRIGMKGGKSRPNGKGR